jgi:hypothetical protein
VHARSVAMVPVSAQTYQRPCHGCSHTAWPAVLSQEGLLVFHCSLPPSPPHCASLFSVTNASGTFSNSTHFIDYAIQPGAAKVFILREAKKNFTNALNDCKALKLPTQAAYSNGTLVHYNTGYKKHRAVEAALVLSKASVFDYWIGLAMPTFGAAGTPWNKTGFLWLDGGTQPSAIPSARDYEGADYR